MVENLVSDDPEHVKGLAGSDGVDDHVAMDADEVFRVEDAVFVLAGGVDDVCGKVLAFVFDGAVEGVFDGGVVVFDESAFDEANGERGFSWKQVLVSALMSRRG